MDISELFTSCTATSDPGMTAALVKYISTVNQRDIPVSFLIWLTRFPEHCRAATQAGLIEVVSSALGDTDTPLSLYLIMALLSHADKHLVTIERLDIAVRLAEGVPEDPASYHLLSLVGRFNPELISAAAVSRAVVGLSHERGELYQTACMGALAEAAKLPSHRWDIVPLALPHILACLRQPKAPVRLLVAGVQLLARLAHSAALVSRLVAAGAVAAVTELVMGGNYAAEVGPRAAVFVAAVLAQAEENNLYEALKSLDCTPQVIQMLAPFELEARWHAFRKRQAIPTFLLDRLPRKNFQAPKCCICLQAYEEGETLLHLGCGHESHETCGLVWYRKAETCPLCREPVIRALTGQVS
jgi:hypothetical protein